jgi:hypothetical protein
MVGLGLPIFGGILFLSGLLILVYLLLSVIKSLKQDSEEKSKRKRGAQNVLLLLLALVLLIGSRLCFWSGESLRSYQIFCQDEAIGELSIEPDERGGKFVVYSFVDRKGNRYDQRIFARGERCQLEIEFLRWDPWLKDLGLVAAYKTVRVNFTSLEEPSVKTMEFPGADDPFWEWVHRFDKPLFFVKTKTLKSDFIELDFEQAQKLIISGERIEIKPEPSPFSSDSTS